VYPYCLQSWIAQAPARPRIREDGCYSTIRIKRHECQLLQLRGAKWKIQESRKFSLKCNVNWRHTFSYGCQGCLAVAISIMVQPRLQISTARLYPLLFIMTCIFCSKFGRKLCYKCKSYTNFLQMA
jgi:hypothetical protein